VVFQVLPFAKQMLFVRHIQKNILAKPARLDQLAAEMLLESYSGDHTEGIILSKHIGKQREGNDWLLYESY
jgi:hypothetical protein